MVSRYRAKVRQTAPCFCINHSWPRLSSFKRGTGGTTSYLGMAKTSDLEKRPLAFFTTHENILQLHVPGGNLLQKDRNMEV